MCSGTMCRMDLAELGTAVRDRRLARKWSVEEAARRADINRVTWKRIERGLGVQDAKRAAVLGVLDLDDGVPASLPSDVMDQTITILREQLNRDLAKFTDHELHEELGIRMALLAAKLRAAGGADEMAFVQDEEGNHILTSRPTHFGSGGEP